MTRSTPGDRTTGDRPGDDSVEFLSRAHQVMGWIAALCLGLGIGGLGVFLYFHPWAISPQDPLVRLTRMRAAATAADTAVKSMEAHIESQMTRKKAIGNEEQVDDPGGTNSEKSAQSSENVVENGGSGGQAEGTEDSQRVGDDPAAPSRPGATGQPAPGKATEDPTRPEISEGNATGLESLQNRAEDGSPVARVNQDVSAALDAFSRAGEVFGISFDWTRYWMLAVLLCSIFPLSAMAFMFLEVPSLISQFCVDYVMLGGQPMTSPSVGRDERIAFTRRWSALSYALHCAPTIAATLLGTYLFFREPDALLDINTQRGMQLGFLGAYIYCLNLVYRRYTTRDLQPHVYLYCAIGLIAGMVFNFVAFTAITGMATTLPPGSEQIAFQGVGAGAAAILAFSLGYFPNLAIRWFSRISWTSLHERQRRSDALPLLLIDGISELHESRLKDEGIDNVQNLAAADIQNLVEKTPYSAQEVVAWIDQAVLYLYLEPGEIESFRRAGVRSITDFHGVWEGLSVQHKVQSDGTVKSIPEVIPKGLSERRKVIAQQLATTEYRLDCLFQATQEGSNMEHVRNYWANIQTTSMRMRERLIHQVCGRVGRTLRESFREGCPPTDVELLGQVMQGLFDAAAESGYDEAIAVTPESLYGQAYLKNKLKDVSEARRLLLLCIEKFPHDPVAYNDLAWLDLHTFSRRVDFERARQYAERAVAIAEKNVEDPKRDGSRFNDLAAYLDTLAFAQLQLGKPEEALKSIDKALQTWKKSGRESEPRLLETLVHTAEALWAKGKTDLAKDALEQAEKEGYMAEEVKRKAANLRGEIKNA